MSIKAVLFDLDGTIRDTESIVYDGIQHTLTIHGVEMPSKEELAPYFHHHSFVHEKFASHVTRDKFNEAYYARIGTLMPKVELFADVHAALEALKEEGYMLGLVTAARSHALDLERLGIDKMFDVIVGGDHLKKHKPDPEGLLLACKKLGVSPEEAVYVGDMVTDIEAGKAAGLAAVIAVSYGFVAPKELATAGARRVVDSLTELPEVVKELE